MTLPFSAFGRFWGIFPQVAGSWHIDALSLAYMKERYGIAASCNCKDQYGTDGYTMWGGYYNGAYYPSRMNMLCPAQTRENQIDVPGFRMLGADPIHQYDLGLGGARAAITPAIARVCGVDGAGICRFRRQLGTGCGGIWMKISTARAVHWLIPAGWAGKFLRLAGD